MMRSTIFAIIGIGFVGTVVAVELPRLEKSYGASRAYTEGDQLVVSTGAVERCWKWTGKGFKTESVKTASGTVIATGVPGTTDWDLGELGPGKIISLKAFENDDEHFTSRHLAVEAEIEYASLTLKYVSWAYPKAPGVRTQLWLKSTKEVKSLGAEISERLKLSHVPEAVTAWGYKAGLKADVEAEKYKVLRTLALGPQDKINKISGLLVELKDNLGMILIKESHSHTSIPGQGCATGTFIRNESVLEVNGLGMRAQDVSPEYRFCWANWMIVYEGQDVMRQLALKQFDRFRYPVNPERDVFIMANTWGTEDAQSQCRYKAREENVLREIKSCAELGLDLLQIDDGWQMGKKGRENNEEWAPKAQGSFSPTVKGKNKAAFDAMTKDEVDSALNELHNGKRVPKTYDVYPDGFGKVRDAAREAGIKLGLWHASRAPLDAIKTNMENGSFKAFKLDFAHCGTKDQLDKLYHKGREIVKHSGYTAVVNWDVTEVAPRMGFYFGRDCGNLYLENRKAATIRDRVLYNPWHILRDAWLLSKYTNLNKIQLTFQNKDHVPERAHVLTDAPSYPHDYNLAITLMSSPILFMETQYLSDEAVGILKPMIASYKRERGDMYKGYVFPIGSMPDNHSWTGLQNHNPETDTGYLIVFRELKNRESKATVGLNFVSPGKTLVLRDVLSDKVVDAVLNDRGELEFEIPKAPGFLFLKYE